jgi:CheY-like chemotaxis protein
MLVKPVSRHELLTAIQRLGKPIQRVLLVDDDPQVAQLFRRMMTTTALIETYIEAYNGAEALNLMRTEKPDLVLLDLMMPEVDGRSVTDQMAEDASLRDIPVIIVSAKGQDYVNFSVNGSIEIYRPDGFQFSEVMQTIEATLSALTPGWGHLDSMEPARAKETVVKLASEDSPKRPMSGLNPVH